MFLAKASFFKGTRKETATCGTIWGGGSNQGDAELGDQREEAFPNRTGSRQKSVDAEEQFNWEKGRAATGLPTVKIITHNPTFKRDQMFREKKMLEVKNLTKLSSK